MRSKNKKNILFIESGSFGGGSFKSLEIIIKYLDPKKYNIFVVSLNKTTFDYNFIKYSKRYYYINDLLYSRSNYSYYLFQYFAYLIDTFFEKYYLKFIKISQLRSINKIKQIITNEKIDIIHLNNNPKRDLFGIVASEQFKKIKLISFIRSTRSSNLEKKIIDYINFNVDQFVSNSIFSKNIWCSKGIKCRNIIVLYNAIENIYPKKIKKIELNKKINFYCIANLIDGKGHYYLLSSYKSLLLKYPNSNLHLIGTGKLKKNLKIFCKKNGIDKKVIFHGYKKNPFLDIELNGIVIVPSYFETFGRVVIESFIAGLPVIATNVGGIPEIIIHKKNGILVSYNDEKQLLNSVDYLVSNDFKPNIFNINIKKKLKIFSIKNHILSLNELYHK